MTKAEITLALKGRRITRVVFATSLSEIRGVTLHLDDKSQVTINATAWQALAFEETA